MHSTPKVRVWCGAGFTANDFSLVYGNHCLMIYSVFQKQIPRNSGPECINRVTANSFFSGRGQF